MLLWKGRRPIASARSKILIQQPWVCSLSVCRVFISSVEINLVGGEFLEEVERVLYKFVDSVETVCRTKIQDDLTSLTRVVDWDMTRGLSAVIAYVLARSIVIDGAPDSYCQWLKCQSNPRRYKESGVEFVARPNPRGPRRSNDERC